jgi:hypothetical protein
MGITHFEGDVVIPFVRLQKEPDVDPKIMKIFPERMDWSFYRKITLRAAHPLVITGLLQAYQ